MATVVEFVGLPGVGKTTLSRAVSDALESDGLHVGEPTRALVELPGAPRVASKARYSLVGVLRRPRSSFSTIHAVLDTDQRSVADAIRVLFNLLYVDGVVETYRSRTGVCLLDQGPYQALWSLGLSSNRRWTDVFDRLDMDRPGRTPDLVVLVEAAESTIASRLAERTNDDTRFSPGDAEFSRATNGFERLKARLTSPGNGPHAIAVENESRSDLEQNATRIADEIRSIDETTE